MASVSELPASSQVILKTDQSKQFLDNLLGQGWDLWGQGLGGGQATELMLQIFGAFNLVALAGISALFIWVVSLSVAGTAHEGVPFGKKFSSLWMPLRFIGSMGALAPIFKGLSLFQVALLACIGWSINLGNHVWNLGVDYFVTNAGQITIQAPNQNVTEYSAIANGALNSLSLQYYLKERRNLDITPGGVWQTNRPQVNFEDYAPNTTIKQNYLFHNSMGVITIMCINPEDALCRAKVNAVEPAVNALKPVAAALVNPDTPQDKIDPLALHNAANMINTSLLDGMKQYAAGNDNKLQKKLKDFQDKTRAYGWFMAGASYWSISWINQEVREAMYSGISYAGPDFNSSELKAMTHGLQDFEAIKQRTKNYIETGYSNRRGISDTTASTSVTGDSSGGFDFVAFVRDTINKYISGNILSWAVTKLSTNDPIMALSNVGDYIIGSAYGLTAALIVLDATPLNKAIKIFSLNTDKYISFILFSVFLPLLIYGLTLAYYLPAIPFIRWISALAGWVILLVESLVAAPLWLCAHALPEGDGAAGQHGKRGYLLFLAVLIRPPLMVAGFFAAVILLNALGKMIGLSFNMFTAGTMQTKVIGLTGTFSMLVILGTTTMILANKFFNLIHYLPEHVTNWIGQQFHSLGEKEDQASAKGVFVGSTNAVSSGGHGAASLRQDALRAREEREQNASPASLPSSSRSSSSGNRERNWEYL